MSPVKLPGEFDIRYRLTPAGGSLSGTRLLLRFVAYQYKVDIVNYRIEITISQHSTGRKIIDIK
ncbi:MAG: hypothetical protein QM229_02730 [Bacillota bacterium]|nr:hypothetical protein [Bacillota bacterium]